MKIAVSSYSFHPLISSGKMTQVDCIYKAKEMGFDAIEFAEVIPPEGVDERDFAQKLREECQKAGLPIVNYATGADFLNGSDGNFEAEIARLKTRVDLAAILGTPCMRHDATRGYSEPGQKFQSFVKVLPRLADGCRQITEYAASKGIRTTVENHGFFCQDSERVELLVNTVNHENFGLLVDIGNFLCADDDPIHACSRVAPYAFHVHAKDFHVKSGMCPDPGEGFFKSRGGNYLGGCIVGHGDVPVQQCLSIIRKAGYDGYVSIEFEGQVEPIKGISIGLANLKRYLAAI